MRAGRLRERIQIMQIDAPTRGAAGSEVENWSQFADVPAEVEEISGSELVTLRAAESVVSVRIKIRYLAGVTADMRVHWGSRKFTIDGPPINPDRRRKSMVFLGAEIG